MRHYLNRLQESIIAKWNTPALSDYRGEDFTFANFATEIARLHTIFRLLDVKSGDKISLSAKNSSRWAMAFLATTTYRSVAVPILCDFTPEMIANLTAHSDSVVLFTEPKMWEQMDVETIPQLRVVISVEGPPDLPPEKSVCRARNNSYNWTWNKRLVENTGHGTKDCMQRTSCEMPG